MGLNRKHFQNNRSPDGPKGRTDHEGLSTDGWGNVSSSDEVQVPRGGTFTLDCPFNGVYVALNFEKNGKRKLIYSRVGFGNFTFKRDGWKDRLISYFTPR